MASPAAKGSAAAAGAAAALSLACEEAASAPAPSDMMLQGVVWMPWVCVDAVHLSGIPPRFSGYCAVLYRILPDRFSIRRHTVLGDVRCVLTAVFTVPYICNRVGTHPAVVVLGIAPIGEIAPGCMYAAPLPQYGPVYFDSAAHPSERSHRGCAKIEERHDLIVFPHPHRRERTHRRDSTGVR